MFQRITILALLIAFIAVDANAQNRRHRRRGAIMGGLAGAAIGAAIGDKGDNETAGALIGGAVGAIAGGTIGDQKDRRIEHNYRYHSGHPSQNYVRPIQPYQGGYYHRGVHPQYNPSQYNSAPYGSPQYGSSQYGPRPAYRQPQVVYPQPAPIVVPADGAAPRSISIDDVVHMVRGGLSESLIIHQIETEGMNRPIAVRDVIQLHQLGVSENIIVAMQTNAPGARPAPVIEEPQPYGPSIIAPTNQ